MLPAALLGALLLVIPAASQASLETDIVEATNAERAQAHAKPLVESTLLSAIADERAGRMASTQNFSHTDDEGYHAWFLMRERGYLFKRAGENIAVNFDDAHAALEAWMNSEGHRANILNDAFQETGIGVAEGRYKGATSTYIVQLFGTPSDERDMQNTGRGDMPAQQGSIDDEPRSQVAAASAATPAELQPTSSEDTKAAVPVMSREVPMAHRILSGLTVFFLTIFAGFRM